MRDFVIRGKRWYDTPLKVMTKILALVVLFVCALAAPQVLAQTDESPTLSASEGLMADLAAMSGADIVSAILSGVILVLLTAVVVALVIHAMLSIVRLLLPLALLGAAGFILYHRQFGEVEVPGWLSTVGIAMLVLGMVMAKKQLGEWAEEQEKDKQPPEKATKMRITIRAARFGTLLKDNLREISGGVFSVVREGHGSGFLIAKYENTGYALTSNHVIGDKETFDIKRTGSDEMAAGNRIKIDSGDINVALVGVNFADAQPLRINTNLPEIGDDVYAIGSPVGVEFEGTLTRGVVGNIRDEAGVRYIQSDAGIGNSGGPLLDKWGNVIGIAAMIQHGDDSASIDLFVPIADALKRLGIVY